MKAIQTISIDKDKKTIEINLEFEGNNKIVTIKDTGDEAENFRAMCRELQKLESDLIKGV